ncbi:hypothetical protein [Paenibacillus amylolyticus]|uniref:hypothetical protein n=1 Tax=Paenibacillus amylolyticus TaxID=1451 RepID=UPI00195F5EAA|nr:hypothetical protein [Paenibacillus amylolyticus]
MIVRVWRQLTGGADVSVNADVEVEVEVEVDVDVDVEVDVSVRAGGELFRIKSSARLRI